MTEDEYLYAKIKKTLELVQHSLSNYQVATDDLKDARHRLIGLLTYLECNYGVKAND